MNLPRSVNIVEVGPRDGLQNEKRSVPTEQKVRLIEALVDAGIRRLEATSFVSPRWIPQLADADEVLRTIRRRPGVVYGALVPNLKGLARALDAKADEVVVFLSASETHSQKNINKSVAEALATYADVVKKAKDAGVRVKGAISTCFGCPYEGDVEPEKVLEIVRGFVAMGVDEVDVADTTGMANPRQVNQVVERVARVLPLDRVALHFHDTRGTGLANVLAGLMAGVTTFDASIGGLGGCPYAHGATGNISTEDAVHMLEEMGISAGIDLGKLLGVARMAGELVGRPLEGHVVKAGPVNHHPGPGGLCRT